MLKRLVAALAMRSPIISVFSIFIAAAGLAGTLYFVPASFHAFQQSPTDRTVQFQIIGLFVFIFIAIRSIFGGILSVIDRAAKIEVGTSIKDSPYDFFRIFDSRSKDIFIIGQNLRTIFSDPNVWSHLVKLLRANNVVKITILITVPGAANTIDEVANAEYKQTIEELVDFYYRRIERRDRERVNIRCHAGATSLSAFIRDPENLSRGLLVFTPKWATDREPGNRIFCVVRKRENAEIFKKLFGHIGIMTGYRSFSLEDVAAKVAVLTPKELARLTMRRYRVRALALHAADEILAAER